MWFVTPYSYLLSGTLCCSKSILYKDLVKYHLLFIMLCYALLLSKIDVIIDYIFAYFNIVAPNVSDKIVLTDII